MRARLEGILERYVPPGVNAWSELRLFFGGLIVSAVWSLSFFFRYMSAYNTLYRWNGVKSVLIEGAVMPDFAEVLGNSLAGFLALSLCMAAFIALHYAYHFQGSRSIYLMRRLENRWELPRRCAVLPIAAAVVCLAAAIVMLLLYFGVYMAFTPKACLAPEQWRRLITSFTGVSL